MEFLQTLLENTEVPLLTAFILGLMTAISPCPLATNITAIGFISKDMESQRRVFVNGLIYTMGRGVSYALIGLLFFFGAAHFQLGDTLQVWGEKIIGPLLILIGLMMLGIINIKIPGLGSITDKMQDQSGKGFWGVLLLGIVFALAFCPYSGVLYFGMLIPMTVSSVSGLYLPIIFALGTGIPVILFAWLIAFSVGSIGTMYHRLKTFEFWFRRVVALLFMGVGI
jgi:cytochrome c biogenesis protein CcdA